MWAFAVWLGLVTGNRPRAHPALYLPHSPDSNGVTPALPVRGCTSMHFGENQLSPGSFGISPLATGHPPILQHGWVRASTGSHPRCTLPMASSPGFGSHAGDVSLAPPCSDGRALPRLRAHGTRRFRSGSTALPPLNLVPGPALRADAGCPPPATLGARRRHALVGSFYKRHAVSPPPSANGRTPVSLRLLVGAGFQGLFHPPRGVLFTFPSRYSFPIGRQRYCALDGGPPRFPPDFACPVVLRVTSHATPAPRRLRGSHPLWPAVPGGSAVRCALPVRGRSNDGGSPKEPR